MPTPSLTILPNPTPHTKLSLSEVSNHRHLDCIQYNQCLSAIALLPLSESFSCTSCLLAPNSMRLFIKHPLRKTLKGATNEEQESLSGTIRSTSGRFVSRSTRISLRTLHRSPLHATDLPLLNATSPPPSSGIPTLLEVISSSPVPKQQLFALLRRTTSRKDKEVGLFSLESECLYYSLSEKLVQNAKEELFPSGIVCSLTRTSTELIIKPIDKKETP